jgi:3-oxoacyl-[acyl-carrier protein] reductase
MQVNGSVVVITGGASGIGAEVARDLAKDGAKIVLGDMNEEGLNQVVDEIKSAGGEAVSVVTNIAKEEDVERLMDTAVDTFGAINVVCANAGIFGDSLMIDTDRATGKVKRVMSTELFKRVVDVNLVGTFVTVREAVRRMVDNGWGGVVILTSSINSTGQPGQINYSSTKAAVTLWPKILVGEFLMRGIKNIRIAGFSPGYSATPILTGMNPDALQAVLKDVHTGRLVETQELASTVRHIVENDAIDGTVIEVTGGLTFGPRQRAK